MPTQAPRPATHASRLRPVLWLLLCASLLGGCDRLDLSTPEQNIAKAKERLAAKDPKSAEIQLKNALQKDGRNVEARLLLGETYLAMHRGQAAEVEASHAEQFGAKPEATLLLRARAYVLQRQYNRVLKDLPAELTGSPDHVADLNQVLGEAQAALGLYNEAEASYDAVLKTRPNSINTLYGKARIDAVRGDLDKAIQVVDQALAIDANSATGLLLKADILFAKQDHDGAMKLYRAAVDASPSSEEARVALGGALIRAGKLDAAEEQIDAIFKRSPNSAQANYLRAVVNFSRHDIKKAFDAVQKVTSALPDFAPAVLLTAAIQYDMKSYLQAEANAQRYVAAYPRSIPARKLLSAIYLKENKPTEAFAAIEPILGQSDLKDSQIFALAGASLARLNKPAQAIEYLAKASALSPDDTAMKTAYGIGSLVGGDVPRAIDTFESLVRVDTSNIDADSILVISYIGRKEYQKAIDASEALVKADPKNALLYNLLGGAYGASGDLKKARENFEKAVAISPESVPAALNLANMEVADKNIEGARNRLTAVLARSPNNLDVLNALADLELSQGRIDDVGKWLAMAAKQNPENLRPTIRLIRFHLQNREPQRALPLARASEAKNPANVELLLLLAQAQSETGDRNAAVATYGRVAGLQPNAAGVQLQIARLEAVDGHVAAARSALAKALAAAPGSVDAQMALAELEIGVGQFAEARRIAAQLEKSPASLPQSRIVLGNIAMAQRKYDVAAKSFGDAFATVKTPYVLTRLHAALAAGGKNAEADGLLSPWLARNPTDEETRLYLAGVTQLAGNGARARELYQQVIDIDPKNVVALNELAILSHAAKDPKALAYAERAYAQQPDSGVIGDTLGWILTDSGDAQRGQQILERAVKAVPWNNEIRYHLAVALMKNGNTDAARTNLKLAVESSGDFAQREQARELLEKL